MTSSITYCCFLCRTKHQNWVCSENFINAVNTTFDIPIAKSFSFIKLIPYLIFLSRSHFFHRINRIKNNFVHKWHGSRYKKTICLHLQSGYCNGKLYAEMYFLAVCVCPDQPCMCANQYGYTLIAFALKRAFHNALHSFVMLTVHFFKDLMFTFLLFCFASIYNLRYIDTKLLSLFLSILFIVLCT